MSTSTIHGAPSPVKRSQSPLLQEVRNHMRRLHMSIRTEQAYLLWLEEFLRYHRDKSGSWQHPTQLGNDCINDFLTYLAVHRKVSASTKNQALSAILFLYRNVLKLVEISIDAERAKTPERLPVVLSVDEVRRVLSCSHCSAFTWLLFRGQTTRLRQVHQDLESPTSRATAVRAR